MSIAFDSIGTRVQVTSGTSVSGSFTNTAGNVVLVIVGESVSASSVCTGVTYNGTAMTKLTEGRVGTGGRFNTLWGWDIVTNGAAPTGSNTLTASFSSSVSFPSFVAISYSGVSTTDPYGATGVYSNASSLVIAPSITTTGTDNYMVVAGRDNAGSRTYTVTEGNLRFNTDAGGYVWADVSVPTATSKTYTLTDNTLLQRLGLAVELNPPAAAAGFAYSQAIII